uniref:RNA helicase n=1 Tax=Peronospora matthiolae TaxID=2874970 RepID=A0AAV1U870_9STRA
MGAASSQSCSSSTMTSSLMHGSLATDPNAHTFISNSRPTCSSPVTKTMADEPPPSVVIAPPLPDAPTCVVCGRYGQYICDATNDDVCSLACRDVCIIRRKTSTQATLSAQRQQLEDALRQEVGIRITAVSAAGTGHKQERQSQVWLPRLLMDFAQKQQDADILPTALVTNLFTNHFERPTPVQMQTIPCVLQGYHVLVSAPTGTGKTMSYLIPAISQVLTARERKEEIMAVVLAPVRELAIQIEMVAKMLMRGIYDMKTALLVGGFPVPTQRYRLKSGVQLIVASPGRFLDIFTNYSGGDTLLSSIQVCIVDEVDVMLDVGFRPQISQIVALLAASGTKNVQLLFFSATISNEVEALVQQVLKTQINQSYIRIDARKDACKADSLKGLPNLYINASATHQVRWAEDKEKKNKLFEFLRTKGNGSTLVFVGSKLGATMLAEAVEKRCNISTAAIHSDKTQQERLRLLEAFVNLEILVLVSTNVLSRGMDLLNVENVVVYDLPKKIEDFVHLIGRTGRGGEKAGNTLTLVNLADRLLFRELALILRQANVSVPCEMYQNIRSQEAKKRANSSDTVVDDHKRAFWIRKQVINGTGNVASQWKEWDEQSRKRHKTGSKHVSST